MNTNNGYSFPPYLDPANAGRNLERILKERGMSQRRLALDAKIQQEAVNRAIRTGKGLSLTRWIKVAQTLGVQVDTLFGVQAIPDENHLSQI